MTHRDADLQVLQVNPIDLERSAKGASRNKALGQCPRETLLLQLGLRSKQQAHILSYTHSSASMHRARRAACLQCNDVRPTTHNPSLSEAQAA